MRIRDIRLDRRGAAGMQYATVLGLIAVIVLAATSLVGSNVNLLMGGVGNRLCNAAGGNCSAGGGGTAPPAPAAAAQLSAGSATVNQTLIPGECGSVTFTNSGTATASGFSAPVVSGSYQIGSCPATSCTGTLAPAASCTVSIQGTATGTGVLSGSVSLTASSGGTANASVSGSASLGGGLYSWGRNQQGQIGDGTNTNAVLPTRVLGVGGSGYLANITAAATSLYSSCAVNSSSQVFCWGYNNEGQLGNNSTSTSYTPVQVVGVGGSGFLTGISGIAGGQYHMCAHGGGGMWCWGRNSNGQLGSSPGNPYVPTQVPGVSGGLMSGVVDIGLGIYHSCALTGGNIACWGYNNYGQTGDNNTVDHVNPTYVLGTSGSGQLSGMTRLVAGSYSTCAGNGNAVYCWGYNPSGGLGDGTSSNQRNYPVQVLGVGGSGFLTGANDIAGGQYFTCALTSGTVKCWGAGSSGQLGNNGTSDIPYPVDVVSTSGSGILSGITQVAAGLLQTCALGSGGAVYCWGHNAYGQLGNNSTTQTQYPVQVLNTTGSAPISGVIRLMHSSPRAYNILAIQ